MSLKKKLVTSLEERLILEISGQSPLKYLKPISAADYIDSVIEVIHGFTRPTKTGRSVAVEVPMPELISSLGHMIRNKLKQKRDSALAAKTGGFILYTFEEAELLEVILGPVSNGHAGYLVRVLNDDAIVKLWESVPQTKAEKLPSEVAYPEWTQGRHTDGTKLVKTNDKSVLDALNIGQHPIVFHCVNEAQKVAWRVNKEIYDIQAWALKNKTDAFADIWEQSNPEAKATKLREAKAIGGIAKRFLHKQYYHRYYFDFRGRKYPNTAYLHEQGSDLSRALIRRVEGKGMGEGGFFWLLVSLASGWAGDAGRTDGLKTDKIPLKARADWALDHEETFIGYAESPKQNQGWMQADVPWQFLAACFELRNLRLWQMAKARELELEPWAFFEDFSYVSSFEAYIDGSNNGSQHLAALTKDEETAPHVNLVASEYPGDLYKFVGDHVWNRLVEIASDYTQQDIELCESLILQLIELKRQIQRSEPRSEKRMALADQIRAFKTENIEQLAKAGVIYWLQVTDAKHKRKIVKRNVMTLPYGGTSYGLGQQIIDDSKKHGIELLLFLEHKWGAYLGREVYETCRRHLKRPMQLLSIFEDAGAAAESRGEFLSWIVPATGFPVVQHYTEGEVKKVWVQYGPPAGERQSTGYYANTLQLQICFIEKSIPSKGKQASGASPNCIHSLDAAHLMLTVWNCPFSITTIHDSFGCLLGDMPELYRITRESFVELYSHDPLAKLMVQIGGDMNRVQIGNLDISEFLNSEYGFS
jgi:DNA-directed RNA polymerase